MSNWLANLWDLPGRAWTAALKAGELREWLSAGAGMAWTVVSLGLVFLFRGEMTAEYAFWIIESALLIVLVTIVAITATGFNLRAGKGGVEVHVGADDDEPRQLAEVTTTTTVTAPAPPPEEK